MKRNFRQIIYFFFFILIKGIAAATALFVAFFFFSTTHTLIQEAWKHKLYSPLTDYYAISISPSIDFDGENMQKLNHALIQFFLKTNNSQSLLLHADTQIRLCDEGFITREELKDENFAITINEAYLANYPIYDIDGNPVTIQGNKSENYLLIPEKYRLQEQKLKNYYEENNTFLKYYIDDLKTMGIDDAHKQKHEKIPTNIIYISNGQSYQIPNMEADGMYKCTLTDPLVSIITNENVSIAQIPAYITNQDYIVKADSQKRLNELKEIIHETGLNSFILNFAPVSQQHLSVMKLSLASLFVYLVILLILQSITFLLEKYTAKKAGAKALICTCLAAWIIALCLFAYLLYSWDFPATFIMVFGTVFLLLADILLLKTAMCINIPIRIPINRNKISEISKAPNHIKY